jgi:glycosyltransferase involved in cell wall biosynthesis
MTNAGQSRDISLIVCTRDRVESLRRTIEAFARLRIPEGRTVEFLVIDNGSTDGTSAFLRGASCASMDLRTDNEPRAGLSRARNKALSIARGRVLVWTDDDVVPDPFWLERLTAPILRGEADAAAGAVLIPADHRERLRGTPLEKNAGYVAATDDIRWTAPQRMVGANMAFAATVLEKVPRFDEYLGAGPTSTGFHEETLFAWQMIDTGHRLVGVPDAAVTHEFDVSRLDNAAILRMAHRIGRSDAYVDWHWLHKPPKRMMFLRKMKATVICRTRAMMSDAVQSFENRFREASFLGYYEEYARCMREQRKYQRYDA